jgi:cytochrome c biogenesis protein ResB
MFKYEVLLLLLLLLRDGLLVKQNCMLYRTVLLLLSLNSLLSLKHQPHKLKQTNKINYYYKKWKHNKPWIQFLTLLLLLFHSFFSFTILIFLMASLSSPLCTWLVAACMSVTCDSHSSLPPRTRRRNNKLHLLSSPNRLSRSGNFPF